VRIKELGSRDEGKAAESRKPPDHVNNEKAPVHLGGYSPRSASQPSELPSSQIRPGQTSHLRHGHSSYPGHRLLQLQRRHGNRYVQKLLESGRTGETDEAAGSDLELAPRSQGVVKNSNPSVSEANHNREPELRSPNDVARLATLTEQPKGRALHREEQIPAAQRPHLKSNKPRIQPAWYNFKIPFTDYQFDPSVEGVKNAAGIAKDAIVDSATWVKDVAVSGFEWIFDQIKELVSSGIDWLNGKFSEIKEFATSSFATLRNGLSNLLANITSPVSTITDAFKNMDADLLGTAWNALKSGATLVWEGFKTIVDGVFSVGTGLWNTVSGYVSSLFGSVRSLIDSWPFRQLPEFLQRGARELFSELQSLWEKVSGFISDTLKNLKSFTDGSLQSIESFVKKVIDYGIEKVLETVKAIKDAWTFIKKIADDPEGFVRPTVEKIAAQLNTEVPPKAIELGHEKLQEASGSGPAAPSGNRVIQREPSPTKQSRSTASSEEVDRGIIGAITAAWANLDIGKMLWESFVNMFWPPATIRAIGREFYELWTADWTNTANSLFMPRNILEEPAGFFHDVWSNFLVLLDFPLALWRRLNNVFMLLLGYITIALVVIGAVGGGIAGAAAGGAGAIPGAWAGAVAGFELAAAIGAVALVSYLGAEAISVINWIGQLRTGRQTEEEKNRDYVHIASSLIGMAIAIILVLLLWLLAEFIAAVVRLIRTGSIKKPAKVAPPPVSEGRETTRVPGLVEAIDPKVPPEGYTFKDTVTPKPGDPIPPGSEVSVTTEVIAPNNTTGSMSRSFNPATGEFTFHYAFLDSIPKDLRMVKTKPEMLAGKGTPLEAYMTLRQIKLLEERAGSVSGPEGFFGAQPRKVHMSHIINTRTIAELAILEQRGMPMNDAIVKTHSVQYANNSIVQGGGRIAKAEVKGGSRTEASNYLFGDEKKVKIDNVEYTVPDDYQVLTGFDIYLDVVPAEAPAPAVPQTGSKPPLIPPAIDTNED
jgi:hypothetical protein